MGAAKQYLLEQESLRNIAAALLKETGAVDECEMHEVLIDTYDPEAVIDAYRLANARISSGEIELLPRHSRRDLTDAIKAVIEETGDDCFACAKNAESD